MRMLRTWAAAALCVTTLYSVPAFAADPTAEDIATARELGKEGQAALDAKDFAKAEDRFSRAYRLYPLAPTLGLGLARAYVGTGKFVAAQETYNRLIREGAPPGNQAFVDAVNSAKAEVGTASARVASVTINVSGAENPKVTVDDAPVSAAALGVRRPVDPGSHLVKATAEGYRPAEQRFTVTEAASTVVNLRLEKDAGGSPAVVPAPVSVEPTSKTEVPPAADTGVKKSGSTQKTLGFVALGVGAVGVGVGVVTGLMAMGQYDKLKEACPEGRCPATEESNLDSYRSMGMLSTVGFIVGGVGAVGGTVLLLTAPKSEKQAFVRPYVTGNGVGAFGRF